jgi:hypothetical protein
MYDEIIITVNSDGSYRQIGFIKNSIYEYVEPFEPKYHNEYLTNDITIFKYLQE